MKRPLGRVGTGQARSSARDVAQFLASNLPFMALIVALTGFLTTALVYLTPLQYSATGTLMIEPGKSPTLRADPLLYSVPTPEVLNSEIRVVKSRSVADTVINRLGLLDRPESRSLGSRVNRSVKGALADLGLIPRLDRRASLAAMIGANLKVKQPVLTALIEISYTAEDPEFAAMLARGIMDAYISRYREIHSDNAAEFFSEMVAQTDRQLEGVRLALQQATSAAAIERLTLERDALQKSYLMYRERLDRSLADQSGNASLVNVRLVDYPSVPQKPLRSRMQRIMMGLAAGVVLALGLAFVREYFDHTVRQPEDIARHVNIPVLGSVRNVSDRSAGSLVSHEVRSGPR